MKVDLTIEALLQILELGYWILKAECSYAKVGENYYVKIKKLVKKEF